MSDTLRVWPACLAAVTAAEVAVMNDTLLHVVACGGSDGSRGPPPTAGQTTAVLPSGYYTFSSLYL